MKRFLLTTTACLLFMSAVLADVIYVTPEGNGEGNSWKEATTLIQALQMAEAGDEIWVAAGLYTPSSTDDRELSFQIPSGVKLYGGFAGDERKLEKRDLTAHQTILSGEIGDETTQEDNSYTVLLMKQADEHTLIDGFVISGAYADGLTEGVSRATCGGGLFIDARDGSVAPSIVNCTFQDNFAREGAAVYVYTEEGEAAPVIRNCDFLRNRADFNGGAIYNDGNFGTCNPIINHCYFEGNRSMYGAAVLNRGLYGNCTPTITECTFTDNFSTIRGGVVYNDRQGRGNIEVVMNDNEVYDDNGNSVGDAIDESQGIDLSLPSDANKAKSSFSIRSTAY